MTDHGSLARYVHCFPSFESNETLVSRGLAHWSIGLEAAKCREAIVRAGFWFLDVPRTGSTSIKTILGRELGYPFGKNGLQTNGRMCSNYSSALLRDHSPAWWIKKVIGESCWKQLETFSIIRNPYDWICSINAYSNRERTKSNLAPLSIAEHLEKYLSQERRGYPLYSGSMTERANLGPAAIYHLTQCDMVIERGQVQVKHLLCFDGINDHFQEVIPRITGIDREVLLAVHCEKSVSKPNLSGSEKRMVEKYLMDDFELYELSRGGGGGGR